MKYINTILLTWVIFHTGDLLKLQEKLNTLDKKTVEESRILVHGRLTPSFYLIYWK